MFSRTILATITSVFSVLLFSGCGSSPQSSPDTGSGTFSLIWEQPTAMPNKASKTSMAVSVPDVCLEYGITTISAKVYNGATEVASGGPWTCTDHQGVIAAIPVGSGLTLQVTGFTGVTTAWQGAKTGVTIVGGTSNNMGSVTMKYVGSWTIATVPGTTGMGQYSSLAFDRSGNPHISHFNSAQQVLSYSTTTLASWATTTVASGATVGQYSSLATDLNGKVHISYHNTTAGILSYTTNSTGPWTFATVDGSSTTGQYTSIAVNANGNSFISYYDATNNKIRYATNVAGFWSVPVSAETSTFAVGQYSSIAIDANGRAYISYYDSSAGRLKYSTNLSGTWIANTIDSSANVGQHTSIALDKNGKAYISYYDVTNGNLKFATNVTGTTWTTTTVDSTGNVGQYTSIALDSYGKAHISYYDVSNGDLKYATNASGAWTTGTIDGTGNVGQYTSIALDPGNKPAISYYDVTNDTLKFARVNAGSWKKYVVESAGTAGFANSIARDGSNNIHMSYYDWANSQVKYATNASGALVTTVVGTIGPMNSFEAVSSIATDSTGTVNIVYFKDASNGYIHLSNNGPSGSWVSTNVPTAAGLPNGSMAMALDSTGHVHVAYMSANNGYPYYTTNKTGVWSTPAQMTTTSWAGFGLSLVIDPGDVIHAAWQEGNSSTTRLVYANNATGSWTPNVVQTFTSSSPGSMGTSIAISPVDGSVSITYNDWSGSLSLQGLNYVTNATGSWVFSTVDKDGQYGEFQSIAIDPSGTKYITYVALDQNLKLAIGTGSAWTIYAIDLVESFASSNWSVSNDLVLDSNNKVHIGYYDAANQDMKYATNAP